MAAMNVRYLCWWCFSPVLVRALLLQNAEDGAMKGWAGRSRQMREQQVCVRMGEGWWLGRLMRDYVVVNTHLTAQVEGPA